MVHDETVMIGETEVVTDAENRVIRRVVLLLVPTSLPSEVDSVGAEVLLHRHRRWMEVGTCEVLLPSVTVELCGLTRNFAEELVKRQDIAMQEVDMSKVMNVAFSTERPCYVCRVNLQMP